jgi:PKD repeat protein
MLLIKPKAAFSSASVLTSCTAPLTVQFDNSSTSATSYIWDFGDGITSTLPTPQHTYTIAGTYSVTLIAISPGGCSDTLIIPKFVRINQPRIYGFINLPFTGCAPATITLRAQ